MKSKEERLRWLAIVGLVSWVLLFIIHIIIYTLSHWMAYNIARWIMLPFTIPVGLVVIYCTSTIYFHWYDCFWTRMMGSIKTKTSA